MTSTDVDPLASKMLDSIKATLTRMLGPESAQAVEYYVDKSLAVKDPEAFERALTSFLGSQAGRLLIEAIKSDLRSGAFDSKMPEPVSRFLKKESGASIPFTRSPGEPRSKSPTPGAAESGRSSIYRERFVEMARKAGGTGASFRDLVTEGLVEIQGETCAFATLACLGGKALDNPEDFAQRARSIFSSDAMVLLESLASFSEKKVNLSQPALS